MTLELEVYKREDLTTRADVLPFRLKASVMEELRGPGAGSFSVNMLDPKILADFDLLNEGNVIKFRSNEEIINAFVIQQVATEIIGDGELADRVYTCTGEGLRTWLRNAILYPVNGFQKLTGESRFFSFASEQGTWYKPAQWINPVLDKKYNSTNHKKGYPADWPDVPNAYWVWDRVQPASGPPYPPVGTSYFRYEFDLSVETPVAVFMAADDYARAYMDAELIIETSGYYETWTKTWRADVTLGPGHHVFAVKMQNNQGPAGLIAAIRKFGDPEQPTSATNITYTGLSGWKMLPYPAAEPGWTTGEVLLKLLDEAQDRGVSTLDLLTPTFTALADSDGVAWNDVQEWEFSIGSEYREIIDKIEELGCDIWIDPETYQLHAVKQRGRFLDVVTPTQDSVTLRRGKNVISAQEQRSSNIKNVLAVKTSEGWTVREDAEVGTSPFGRSEGTFSTDATMNMATKVANVAFDIFARPEISSTYEFLSTSDIMPYQKIFLGDWVRAPDSRGNLPKRRIVSLSVTEDNVGNEVFSAEFDNYFNDRTMRNERWLEMISKGRALGGKLANSSLTSGVTKGSGSFKNSGAVSGGGSGGSATPPEAPISLFGKPEEIKTSTGVSFFRADLGWDAVTADTAGTAITPRAYLIWARRTRSLGERTVTNLCRNPNFETGVSGVVTNNVTAVQSADWVLAGTRSLKVTPSTTSTESYVSLDSGPGGMRSGMAAGGTYTASVTMVMSATMGASEPQYARTIQIVYVTPSGTTVVSSRQGDNTISEQILNVTATIPVNATEAWIRLYNGTGTGASRDVYFDGVMLTTGSTYVPFFDGSFDDSDVHTYAWTGTANASSSTRVETDVYYLVGGSETNGGIVGEFYPGETWSLGVMAQSSGGSLSAMSAPVSITFPQIASRQQAPTAPTLSTQYGSVTVSWDGLLGTNEPPATFSHVYLGVSTSENGAYVPMGQTLMQRGSLVLSDLTSGVDYWFRLHAVDKSGNISGASPTATITVSFGSSGSYTLPGRLSTVGQEIVDWNDALTPGFYWGRSDALNNPTGNISVGEVHVGGDSVNPRVMQNVWFPSSSEPSLRKAWRRILNPTTGVWFAWTQTEGLDLPWTNVTVASGFAQLSSTERPQVRMVGGVVYGKGGWNTTGISAVSTQYTIGTMPAAFVVPGGVRATAYTAFAAQNGTFLIDSAGQVILRTGASITSASYYLFGNSQLYVPDTTP